MAAPVENWDDDADFKGDFFGNSVSTVQTSFSSRISLHSESNAGDEAWDVVFASNDENSTQNAIVSAKQKGVPIPANVPSSALLGTGTITRLGKKKSRQNVDDDWGMDMELPGGTASPLKLKPQVSQDSAKRPTRPTTPSNNEDDFDLDWAEGSLGVRFGGTKRELRNRSSSTSAMSPSMGSCMTVESEEDGLDGLVVPNEPLDFNALLKKRKETEREAPAISSPQPAVSQKSPQPTPPPTAPALAAPAEVKPQSNVLKADDDEDDMLGGLDIGAELIDPKKPTYNRNIKITSNKIQIPPVRSTTTLTFTDKPPASRIPRPATTTKSTKLDPVYEPGAVQVTRTAGSRAAPTTTSSQLLRAKRSAPVLRSQPPLNSKPSIPFLPAGASSSQSHHVTAKAPPPYLGFRRDSNPDRGQSPPPRSFSRISRLDRAPDTPSRSGFRRGDLAPAALSREAMTKRNLTKPARRRNFGDGSELDLFDDLPTSASKESLFMKEPVAAGKPGQKPKLKTQSSMSRLLFGDRTRTQTPVPPPTPTTVASTATGTTFGMPTTPRGLTRFQENTPSFARDTTASRNAREQRLQNINTRSRDGPLNQVQTNWKAQVALRNPQLSPTTTRGKNKGESKRPQLISWIKPESVRNEKGMTYNLKFNRWEGNENQFESEFSGFYQNQANPSTTTLPLHPTHSANHSRHHHTSSIPTGLGLLQPQAARSQPFLGHYQHQHSQFSRARQDGSPPRRTPALISQVAAPDKVQVEKGMVLDPRLMKWLKIDPRSTQAAKGGMSPSSLSVEDEDDPFAGIDDLPDDKGKEPEAVASSGAPGGSEGGNDDLRLDARAADEAFDVGEAFVKRHKAEEEMWMRRVQGWIGSWREELGEGWRWSIRERAMEWEMERAAAAAR